MKVKTSELQDAALDWAVAKCEGSWILSMESFAPNHRLRRMNFSTDWAQGGPIIEQEGVQITPVDGRIWTAIVHRYLFDDDEKAAYQEGPTALIAGMRCYVASKLGDEIEIPEELA